MKIAEYNEMMAYLTRPEPQSTKNINRENFYAGSSLEQFGSKIKDLYLKGTSSPKINELLGFEKDRSTTIDDFIKSMKKGEAPVKITADELSKRPNIIGTNISGKPGERVKDLQKYISNYKKENKGRLPSKAELRAANFDLVSTINPAIERGDIEVLPEGESRTRGGYTRTNKELQLLADNQKVLDIFRKGDPSLKDLETIKKVIGPVSDKVAASRILQLANIFANTGVEEARDLNIKPQFKKNALKIIEASDFQQYLRDAYEEMIGKSVGEKSIKKIKQEIRGSNLYKQSDLSKFYSIDELLGATSSAVKGTTPYGIFGQIIEGGLNRKEKSIWDAEKSKLELKLQNTIKEFGKNSKETKDVVREFNRKAKEAEETLNYGKAIGAKKVTIPKVSLQAPGSTIANFKDFNKTYKEAFKNNFKEKGYSFEIPKNIKTIPQLRDDIKNPKSSTYKSLINSLKKGLNEYDEKKLFQKLKNATPESIKKNLKFIPRIASLGDDISDKRYASASNIMSDATYVDDKAEQESFVERNPFTTAAAGTTAATGALTGSKLLKSDPLKKPRRFSKKVAKQIASIPLKTIGSVTAGLGFAGSELASEDPNLAVAGSEMLLPEIGKAVSKGPGAKGILSAAGRFALNPFQALEKLGKYGKIGRAVAMGARIPSLMNPVGLGLMGIEGIRAGMREQDRINTMRETDPEAYQQYIADQEEMLRQSAAYGGRIGFAEGPEDPSKRKFMKIMGGLASLPIVGRFFDVAQVAEKAAPAAIETFKNAPPHFMGLVNKIRALGKIVDPKKTSYIADKNINNIYDYGDYRMIESKDGGIAIKKDNLMATDYGDATMSEEYMQYSPGKIDKKTGKKIEDDYYEENTSYADQDGELKDVQEGVLDDTIDEGTYSKEELEQLIIEQVEQNLKKGKK